MSDNPVLFGIVDSARVTQQGMLDNVCFGQVKWLSPRPSAQQVTCPICKCIMTLLVQVSCPFPGRGSDLFRKLVVCVCIEHSKQQEGWRVIRQVTKETKPPAAPKPDSADWGGDDDWGDDEDEQVNWMAKKVEDITMENVTQPSTSLAEEGDVELGVLDTGLYVNVVEDDPADSNTLDHENELYRRYQMGEQVEHPTAAGAAGSVSNMEEDDEDDDSTIEDFLSTLRRLPNQILRYQVLGTPLSLDPCQFSSGRLPPCCDSCGASRCFELQLMPKLVDLTKGRVQFGTVQIFTCSANCSRDQNHVEHALLQSEPDATDYK